MTNEDLVYQRVVTSLRAQLEEAYSQIVSQKHELEEMHMLYAQLMDLAREIDENGDEDPLGVLKAYVQDTQHPLLDEDYIPF